MMNNSFIGKIHSDDLNYYLKALSKLHQNESNYLFCEYRIKGKTIHAMDTDSGDSYLLIKRTDQSANFSATTEIFPK